jgi:hypothetical protein
MSASFVGAAVSSMSTLCSVLTFAHAFCWAHVKPHGGLVAVHLAAEAHLPQVDLQKLLDLIQALEHCSGSGDGACTVFCWAAE